MSVILDFITNLYVTPTIILIVIFSLFAMFSERVPALISFIALHFVLFKIWLFGAFGLYI